MNIQTQAQNAMHALSAAFAPMSCVIDAPSKRGFSFIIVNEHGVAKHTRRIYRDEYSNPSRLQAIIDSTRLAIAG